MQQALNAGNVHSKRTVSKPLILLVIKALSVMLTDPRLWRLSLSNALWQLTFHDWQLVGCCLLGARTKVFVRVGIFGSTCSCIKSQKLLDGSHLFPNLYEHEKEAEKKFLGTVSIFFIF